MLSRRLINISVHLIFWGAFLGLFFLQSENPNLKDFSIWLLILSVSAITVYCNLYLLLPKFFYEKRYFLYAITLLALLFGAAAVLFFLLPRNHPVYGTPFFQHVINLLFFVLISSSLSLLRNQIKKQKRLQKLQQKQMESELKLLRGQINPHFLLNTLNNLYGLILDKDNENAAEIVLKLSGLMRYLLYTSQEKQVTLKEEIIFIEDYIALEKIRISAPVSISIEIEFNGNDIKIIPMILIPFVENVFKHGLMQQQEHGFVNFKLVLDDNELFFSTENSTPAEDIKNSTKLGLENLKQRLKLAYPNSYEVSTKKVDNIYYAELKIKL